MSLMWKINLRTEFSSSMLIPRFQIVFDRHNNLTSQSYLLLFSTIERCLVHVCLSLENSEGTCCIPYCKRKVSFSSSPAALLQYSITPVRTIDVAVRLQKSLSQLLSLYRRRSQSNLSGASGGQPSDWNLDDHVSVCPFTSWTNRNDICEHCWLLPF